MALVMLPCELPWWGTVQRHLTKLLQAQNTSDLTEGMRNIHELCNISIDPDDEERIERETFADLAEFLDNDLTPEEKTNFFNNTLPNIVNRAMNLKKWKPKRGLHFSLQQQSDSTEIDYNFVSSLIANAFFSTFPKRTDKSHPTLQNFNFVTFFKSLGLNSQKAKLRSFMYYFDWLGTNTNSVGYMRVVRQVMSSKEWLTIEDWLECTLPLCPLQIKHEGRLERSDEDTMQVCFSSSKIGGRVLLDGVSQECISLVTFPEILSVLLHVEALEDNEVLMVEKPRHITRILDPKNRACLEKIEVPRQISVSCIDAENYTQYPISQYEEDNILRELNKCLLAFQQKNTKSNEVPEGQAQCFRQRRLSPIGESVGSSIEPPEKAVPFITQESCSTNRSQSPHDIRNRLSWDKLRVAPTGTLNNRKGRFIVLGSSGECLPVNRHEPIRLTPPESCSSSEEYHSAKTSFEEGSEDEDSNRRYNADLRTAERRHSFAQRLRDALHREENTTSSESNYAVGISVTGSKVEDQNIKLRRGGSTGFILKEESLDEEFLQTSLQQEQEWIDKFKTKQTSLSKKDSVKSTESSLSTEFSSELEEVYEQFSKWLKDPILETDKEEKRVLDQRDMAVVQFAGSLLKRTLSESFAGVPLTEGCINATSSNADNHTVLNKSKIVLNARSLSLELARQKHRLAAQLLTQIAQRPKGSLKVVTTGNWGCGSSKGGEVQLKVIIQWLAASVAGVPALVYYTCGHQQLAMLDTICRILIDRKWTVKDLAEATLRYSSQMITPKTKSIYTLFEELIGVEKAT
ncbi:uncharacterized protein LOC116173569 isoform X1 [Photinus pyralis]|nr:uncharacterized protein LOC116173569 isoform X1 [Photinus pyralis]XP_031346956.1 uncharacterized protein LOC116173569 isoform X1 [Photinus pyralis]XP_031346957.1 uncharacterized protein LOC116173569 isoform X1 [Photinus pyralis]